MHVSTLVANVGYFNSSRLTICHGNFIIFGRSTAYVKCLTIDLLKILTTMLFLSNYVLIIMRNLTNILIQFYHLVSKQKFFLVIHESHSLHKGQHGLEFFFSSLFLLLPLPCNQINKKMKNLFSLALSFLYLYLFIIFFL